MNKILSFTILMFFLIYSLPVSVFAVTADDVRKQIENTNNQIEAINKEIKKYEAELAKTGTEKNTLTKAVKELTLTRDKLVKEKQQTEKKIIATGLIINTLDSNISEHEKNIYNSQKVLADMLNELNHNDKKTILEKILTRKTLGEMSLEYNNIIAFNQDLKNKILEIKGVKEKLTETKNEKEGEKNKLTQLKKDLSLKETVINTTKKEKDNLLIKTKNKESEYQKLLAERIKKRDAFEKNLAEYEDQLKFILDPKSLPKDGSSALSWPLDYVFITQLFGITSASKRLYRSGSHSGVDFRAAIGTPVKSMANGTVMGTGDTDLYCKGASFGKWVFVKFDNGLSSTYGHLSAIGVKKGDKVKTGDILGLSGNTGHSTGPHLHISVYASDGAYVDTVPSLSCSGKTFIMPIASSKAYLDPMLYLPPISKDKIKK